MDHSPRPLHTTISVVIGKKKAMEGSRMRSYRTKKTGRREWVSGSGSIQMKMRKLRVLVPGGRSLKQSDLLLSKTADYIMHLELRIRFLKALSDFYSLSQNWFFIFIFFINLHLLRFWLIINQIISLCLSQIVRRKFVTSYGIFVFSGN